jgi:hypothetical protein
MPGPPARPHLVWTTLLLYAGVTIAWTLAWQIQVTRIDTRFPWFTTSAGAVLWWTVV